MGQTSRRAQRSCFRELRKTEDNVDSLNAWNLHSWERAEVTRTLGSWMGRAGGAELARTRTKEEAQRFKSSRRRALSCPCVTSDGGGGTAASLSAAAVSFS